MQPLNQNFNQMIMDYNKFLIIPYLILLNLWHLKVIISLNPIQFKGIYIEFSIFQFPYLLI